MYASCLFCHHHLGRNALVPTFAVGGRLAYDPERGRLWVVCPRCARWNLTPLEERWEAIETCEHLFADTPVRLATDHVGLAEVPDGLTLVRVGRAPRPELAAWRYGRVLRRQLRRHPAGRAVARVVGRVAEGAETAARAAARAAGLRLPGYDALTWLRVHLHGDRPLAVVPDAAGAPLVLRWSHLEGAELLRPERREPWRIVVRQGDAVVTLAGEAGLRTAGKLLAALNGPGASYEHVRAAMRKVEDAGDPDGFFARIAELAHRASWGRHPDAPPPGVEVRDEEGLPVLHVDPLSGVDELIIRLF